MFLQNSCTTCKLNSVMPYIRVSLFLSLFSIYACQPTKVHSASLQLHTIFTKHFTQETIAKVDISADGFYFLAGSSVEKMRVWDIKQLNKTFETGFESELVSLEFTENNNSIFFANKIGTTRLYDRELKETLFEYRFPVTSRFGVISYDLDYIVYGDNILNRTQDKLLSSVVGHGAQSSLGLSNKNDILTSGFHDERVVVRDTSGKRLVDRRLGNPVLSAGISEDSKIVIAGTQNGNCYIWQLSSQQTDHRCDSVEPVNTVYINKLNTIAVLIRSKSIAAYDLLSYKKIFEESVETEIYSSILAENDWLVLGLRSGKIQIWNIKDSTLLATIQASKERITSLDLNPKAKLLLTGSYDGNVTLYKIKN